MSEHGGGQVFLLHFRGADAERRAVPADLLLRSVASVQRIVRLLDSFRRGRPLNRHARNARGGRPRFALLCRVSKGGGYVQPIEIGRHPVYGSHVEDDDLEAIALDFRRSAEAINSGDDDLLSRVVPDPGHRELLIENYRAALPPISGGIALRIEDESGQTILDGKIAVKWMNEIIIERREFFFCNKIYRADPPLRFRASFDPHHRLYDLEGDFGIEISVESRSELTEALDSMIEMLWSEYALENPERLTGDARILRRQLRDKIRETWR